jgi:N-carbamoylputrescine amidase
MDCVLFVFALQMIPVIASNRQGTEILLHPDGSEKQRITFYGRSFITDATGALVAHAVDNDTPKHSSSSEKPFTILTSTIDPEANRSERLAWGLFRDRRPELYPVLLTKDGKQQSS